MELRQLRYFVTVAEELHFSRAARRLQISQPPLSVQIRNLERELGVQLLERTSRKVDLTAAGEAFLEEARALLARVEEVVETTRGTARGETGRLSVGFVAVAMDAFLPGFIRRFTRRHSGITLQLNELGTNQQLEGLRARRLHVGFIRLFRHDLTGLDAKVVIRVPYLLAMAANHRLARRKRVPLSALDGVEMIVAPRHVQPALHDEIVACCERSGFTPRFTQEVFTKRSAVALASAGLGVAMVPATTGKVRFPNVVYRPLTGPLPKVEIAAIWRQGNVPAALDRLIDLLPVPSAAG